MTKVYVDGWLADANHYRMQLLGEAADNPDQRIADDILLFRRTRTLAGLAHFWRRGLVSVLRGDPVGAVGRRAVRNLRDTRSRSRAISSGRRCSIRLSALFLTHWIGAPLIKLHFQQQRYEADFRFDLVRVRENSEQIALMHAEAAEGQPPAQPLHLCDRKLAPRSCCGPAK